MSSFLKPHSTLFVAIGLLLSSYSNADVISENTASDIQEPVGTYNSAAPTLLNMNATTVIGAGVCIPSSYDGCTLNDVLNDINPSDDFKPEVKVHFTADDFPDDGLVSNATLRQRGATSRGAPQKSFRIKLDSKDDLWRGQRKMQLVKAVYDFTRVRNKLSYDLLKEIPHLPSMRTQFVHLNINDQGSNEDYGMYTHVENFGKEYLVRRGWDDDSRVYKAESFDYYSTSALDIDPVTEKPIDVDAFEKVLEIKRGKKHSSLTKMVRDLNDPNTDFNTQVMGKYFNLDNYLSWFAFNILVNNADTSHHNYYLYNPKSNDHFYIVPWDYDLSFGQTLDDPTEPLEQLPRWWFSQANWWKILLHRRFLSEPGNLDLLKTAVLEFKNKHLTPAKIQAKTDSYYNIVFPIIRQQPDWNYLYVQGNTDPERVADFNRVFSDLANNVEENYARFIERVNDPMTFSIYSPQFLSNHDIKFDWSESKSLTNQSIVYDLEVSTTKDFKVGTIISTTSNLQNTDYTLHWTYPKGTYYFRVRAKDAANPLLHWQEATTGTGLEYDSGVTIYGVRDFYVSEDGDVTPPPTGTISNPVLSLNIDANDSDWNGLTAFANDADDIANNSINVIDWQNAAVAHSDQNIYLLFKNYGAINPTQNSGSYIPWGWQVFIDTDNNPNTGFQYTSEVGADFVLEGTELLRYNGTGSGWNWVTVGDVNNRFSGNINELGFPRAWLGTVSNSLKFVFQGVNDAFGGNSIDFYPDEAAQSQTNQGFFSYSLGVITPPTNQAPVAVGQNRSLHENTSASLSLSASDADGDPLSLIITQQPVNGSLTLSGSSLVVAYTPNQNYIGADSFKFKVNDGQVDSNVATVQLNVTPSTPGIGISNPVPLGGITINGVSTDWNNLTFFDNDPSDIASNINNSKDWKKAGLAHSSDTVYLMYESYNRIDLSDISGSTLNWGWQTFIDVDRDTTTGFQFDNSVGADYLLEGNYVYQYNGNGDNWEWVELGSAEIFFNGKVVELSFPRSWLTNHTNVKVAFYGNNESVSGNFYDSYPNTGGFDYAFGSGAFGQRVVVASAQSSHMSSPADHRPEITSVVSTTTNPNTGSEESGGGSFSWLLSLGTLFLLRRRKFMS